MNLWFTSVELESFLHRNFYSSEKMRTLLVVLLFCFGITGMYGQLDRSSGSSGTLNSRGIPMERNEPSTLELPRNTSLSKKRGIYKTTSELVDPDKPEEKPINMTTDNGLLNYEIEFKPAYIKDREVKDEYGNDMYFGDFRTKGKSVDLFFRDHEFVDGDKIRIVVNDEIVYSSLTLTGRFRPVLLQLKDGFNQIDIIALNQGSSGPNTAEFKLLDENGKVLKADEWNLTTGTKGTFIIVKD